MSVAAVDPADVAITRADWCTLCAPAEMQEWSCHRCGRQSCTSEKLNVICKITSAESFIPLSSPFRKRSTSWDDMQNIARGRAEICFQHRLGIRDTFHLLAYHSKPKKSGSADSNMSQRYRESVFSRSGQRACDLCTR